MWPSPGVLQGKHSPGQAADVASSPCSRGVQPAWDLPAVHSLLALGATLFPSLLCLKENPRVSLLGLDA